jgi:hypothetical protein
MDSPIIPKSSINESNKKQPTSEILANHPLTKNMNNLSSLIKPKDSHHHHHHHPATNKNLTQTASSITREELFFKYQSFLQMSIDDFEIILHQLRALKLTNNQIIEFLQYLFDQSLHEHNKNILFLVRLFIYLHKNTFITNQQCLHVLTNILSKIHDYEKEFSLFKSELATIIANIIGNCLTNEQDGNLNLDKKPLIGNISFLFLDVSNKNNGSNNISKKNTTVLLSLNDVCDLLKDGQHHPLFLLVLQQLQQLFNNDENYM